MKLYQVSDDQIRDFERDLAAAADRYEVFNAFLFPGDEAPACRFPSVDLDKSWGMIHFCLTGTSFGGEPPWNFLLSDGDTPDATSGVDVSLAVHSAASIRPFAAALRGLTTAELAARFTPEMMGRMALADVYPTGWFAPPRRPPGRDLPGPRDDEAGRRFIAEHVDNLHRYLADYYDRLREFTLATADRGMGLLRYIG